MLQLPQHEFWLGNRGDLLRPADLRRTGIQAVLDLALEELPFQWHREGIVLRVPIIDGPGNQPEFLRIAVRTAAELLATNMPTLIVCSAGLSRTPVIAAVGLAIHTGNTPLECLQTIRSITHTDVSLALWQDALQCCGLAR
jgi:protein-tyrosine phosphatase